MNKTSGRSSTPASATPPSGRPRVMVWIVGIGALVLLLALVLPRTRNRSTDLEKAPQFSGVDGTAGASGAAATAARERARSRLSGALGGSGQSAAPPEALVADQVARFGQSRRALAEAYASHLGIIVPPQVSEFFAAVEGGDWSSVKNAFTTLSAQFEGREVAELQKLWPAVREAYVAAQLAAAWPAQDLLNYSQSVAASLPADGVYLANSDALGVLPLMAAETGGSGSRPMNISPEMLGDSNYLDYLAFSQGSRLQVPGQSEFQEALDRAGQDVIARALHDRENPGATPQLRPGEQVVFDTAGNPVVSTSTLHEATRASLVQSLLQKNPGLSLAIADPQVAAAYGLDVVPDGPVLKAVAPGTGGLTEASAGSAVQYWRQTAQQLGSDIDPESPLRRTYAVSATSQADWLLKNNQATAAEQAYQAARQIAPTAYEPTERLARLMAAQGRTQELQQLLDQFVAANPDQRSTINSLRGQLAPATP